MQPRKCSLGSVVLSTDHIFSNRHFPPPIYFLYEIVRCVVKGKETDIAEITLLRVVQKVRD